MSKRPDYGDATPEDLARALMKPVNRPVSKSQSGDEPREKRPAKDPQGARILQWEDVRAVEDGRFPLEVGDTVWSSEPAE